MGAVACFQPYRLFSFLSANPLLQPPQQPRGIAEKNERGTKKPDPMPVRFGPLSVCSV
jgi:hypothetical protein